MTSRRPLKIAYLCDLPPQEPWTYSGGNALIYNALRRHVGEVHVLDPGWHRIDFMRKLLHRLPVSLNLRLRWRLHLLFAGQIAKGVQKELKQGSYDVLFCAYSFQSLAGVVPPYPMVTVFTSDATPSTYKQSEIGQSFGSFFSLSRRLDPIIQRAEERVFTRLDAMLCPSHWLKDASDQMYGLRDGQSIVVHWGANIPTPPKKTLELDLPFDGPVRLLLVGRDWFAKGGPTTFDTLKALLARGVDAHLTVVGCVPPDFHTCDQMTVHPSLDKKDPDQLAVFEALYRNAHFMVMPSFESYGFAFCEASAYGLPSLCLRVGGVPVIDGVNGHALPAGSGADAFADRITDYLADPDAYRALRVSSRAYFEDHLNWDAWGGHVARILDQKVAFLPGR